MMLQAASEEIERLREEIERLPFELVSLCPYRYL